MTEGFARRHGMEEVIGKKLTDGNKVISIAGIIEDFSGTVFEDFEFIINSMAIVPRDQNYVSSSVMTFFKAADGADIALLEEKVSKVAGEFFKRIQYPREEKAMLIRLDKLYFSDANDGRTGLKTESSDRVMIFSLVVLFLLISAIINYINLNIANAEKRSKEVAVRDIHYCIGGCLLADRSDQRTSPVGNSDKAFVRLGLHRNIRHVDHAYCSNLRHCRLNDNIKGQDHEQHKNEDTYGEDVHGNSIRDIIHNDFRSDHNGNADEAYDRTRDVRKCR